MKKHALVMTLGACALAACGAGDPAPAPASPADAAGASGGHAGGGEGQDAARGADRGAMSDVPGAGGSAGPDGPAAAGGTAGGQGGSAAGGADAASPDAASPDAASAWPAIAEYGAAGPFAIMRESNTGPGAGYDIFRPVTLGAEARKHPIISWANGTLFGIKDYQKLLEHWASHGFVVIASHSNSTAGGATHKAGIDWLIAESARSGGTYFGVLDTKHVGAAGHSQGGGATIAAGSNKPGATGVVATLPLMPILSFESDKTIVAHQTAPMLNINATMDNRDPTGAIAKQIFEGATAELVQAAYTGVHEDAMSAAMHAPTLAWFRLRLMSDEAARAVFYPPGTCGLCRDPAWKQVRYQKVP